MDVSKPLRGFVLVATLILLSACGSDDKTVETVFPEETTCQQNRVENQFLVTWKSGLISMEIAANRDEFVEDFLKENLEKIEYVQYDQWIEPSPQPEPLLQTQTIITDSLIYGPAQLDASAAWSRGVRGQGVLVAVIDSGVDISHSQLRDQIDFNLGESGLDSDGKDKSTNGVDDDGNGLVDDYAGYDFYEGQSLQKSLDGSDSHGTHVAGIIAAAHDDMTTDPSKVQGIAPESKILPLRFIGPNGGLLSDSIKAIDYAISRGARVINASWGGSSCSKTLEQKIQSLSREGVLFVAAAGNNHSNIDKLFEFPASFNLPTQITVGATTQNLNQADFSNYGDVRVHIFAPGHRIVSTLPNDTLGEMSGTSMSAPFISGVAALLLSARPTASIQEVRSAILNSVTIRSDYRNSTQGRVNVRNAIDYLESH
ncbi:MAG: S8 family serine peptidase [Bdellovibrionales bacterium]|nr:S8 family serine peptidase [Bdellovibrionales bacterium]